MKKSDKKIEKQLREALTKVCEAALEQVTGFKWLTHLVNYRSFPNSLSVICVFDTNSELDDARAGREDVYLIDLIEKELIAAGLQIRDIKQRVKFDTEENCQKESNGKWNHRFNH